VGRQTDGRTESNNEYHEQTDIQKTEKTNLRGHKKEKKLLKEIW
jgi:hypothetical protein